MTIVVRGKLEIRAKTTSSKNKDVRLACLIDVNRTMPERTIRFKINSHHMREKKKKSIKNMNSLSSSTLSSHGTPNSSSSSSSSPATTTTYQCMLPAHPSRKKAMKIMQYITKEYTTFVHSPFQQHIKITPNLLLDSRIDSITKNNVARLAYRIKLSKNPATDWSRCMITNMKVVALFPESLPKGCKLLCKPKATFHENERILTWNIDDNYFLKNKKKMKKIYLDAMFTYHPSHNGEEVVTSLDAGNEEMLQPRLTITFQVKSKGRDDENGGTNTSIMFSSAKESAKIKATVRKKMLVTIRM